MTIAAALANAVQRLKAAQIPDAANDTRVLLAAALGVERSRLTLVLPDELPAEENAEFERFIAARLTRQPVAQIIGTRDFYGRSFTVTPDVLDPRPDTERLIQVALSEPFKTLLDLGTGSGCIALTLLAENLAATGLAGDYSSAALDVARDNAVALGLQNRCEFTQSDWLAQISGQFDLIVSNPPYITDAEMATLAPEVRNWEPVMALTPGGDGLASYRIIAATAMAHLTRNGRLIVEIGPTQGQSVQALFLAAGFDGITCFQDMDGRDRVVLGRKS